MRARQCVGTALRAAPLLTILLPPHTPQEVYDLLHLTGKRLPLRYDQLNHAFFVEGQVVVDCRTPDEHATAKIAGALLLPMQELTERIGELDAWKTKPIIVHCHHGVRSLRVTHWLRERGFPNVSSMQGGIDAWSTDVDRTVPRY